jgi:hypothetical protein
MMNNENRMMYTQEEKQAIEAVAAVFKDDIAMLHEELGENYIALVWVEAYESYWCLYRTHDDTVEGVLVQNAEELVAAYMRELSARIYFQYEAECDEKGKSAVLAETYIQMQRAKIDAYIQKLPQYRGVLEEAHSSAVDMYNKLGF